MRGAADPVAALAFAADGRGIVAVSRAGMAWQWDAKTGKALVRSLRTSEEENTPPLAPNQKNASGRLPAKGDGE